MIEAVKLDYDLDIFTSADYDVHSGSCISHQVHELQDVHERFGGFPDSYDLGNTMIRQLWWTREQIDFDQIGKQLGIEVVTISSILQPAGNMIPVHRDTFFQIKKAHPDDTRLKVRANMYLQDWAIGEFLQYEKEKEWHNSTHWKAGEGWIWDSKHLHLSANAGMRNKYTLQVSGFYNR
tara:strand:+ start:30 stop:566 length:537 start_codon:yes stop_codon:yes gene_type:complete